MSEKVVNPKKISVLRDKLVKMSFFLKFFSEGGKCLPVVEFLARVLCLSFSFFCGRCYKKEPELVTRVN